MANWYDHAIVDFYSLINICWDFMFVHFTVRMVSFSFEQQPGISFKYSKKPLQKGSSFAVSFVNISVTWLPCILLLQGQVYLVINFHWKDLFDWNSFDLKVSKNPKHPTYPNQLLFKLRNLILCLLSRFWVRTLCNDFCLCAFHSCSRYYSHDNDYLEICRCYKAIYEIPSVKENPAQWIPVRTFFFLVFGLLRLLWNLLDGLDILQHVGLEENLLVLGTFTSRSNAVKPSEFHLGG
jgi:hypothetical protein